MKKEDSWKKYDEGVSDGSKFAYIYGGAIVFLSLLIYQLVIPISFLVLFISVIITLILIKILVSVMSSIASSPGGRFSM